MDKSISVTFNNNVIVKKSEYWIKLELVENEDTATLGETAELLDSIYELNPCTESVNNELVVEDEKPEPLTLQDFEAIVRNQFKINMCNANFNNDYIAQIKVFKSHRDVPYTLKFDNGELKSSTFKQELVTENLVVENATSVTLSYTLVGNLTHSLNNYVNTDNNTTAPNIVIDGSTISWDVPITASFTVSYLTEYDLVDITVFANDEGEMGECQVLCFYHGLVEELTLTPPDIDEDTNEIYRSKYCGRSQIEIPSSDEVTCYETVTKIYKCQCSGEKAYEVTEKVNVTCPDNMRCPRDFNTRINNGIASCEVNLGFRSVHAGYVDCGETTEDISDPAFYMDYCCDYPQVTLPKCDVYYEKNPGGKTLDTDKQNSYIAEYGDLVDIIYVSPKDGDCGNIKYNQVRNRKNCCDEVEPIEIDVYNSADIIGDNSGGYVVFTGGRYPFSVSIRGSGFWLDYNRTIKDGIINSNIFIIYTSDACGSCKITISDGCSVANYFVKSTNGQWVPTYIGACTPELKGKVSASEYLSLGYGSALFTGFYDSGTRKMVQTGGWQWRTFCCAELEGCGDGYMNCDSWNTLGCLAFSAALIGANNFGTVIYETNCSFALLPFNSGSCPVGQTEIVLYNKYYDWQVEIFEWRC